MNAIERLRERIEVALPTIPSDSEDHRVLSYISDEFSASRLVARAEDEYQEGSTLHLEEVAKRRLRPYEKEISA